MWQRIINIAIISAFSISGLVSANDHMQGPNGGFLVSLSDKVHHAEVVLRDSESVIIHVLDADKRAVSLDASNITITFTEPDGEKEDYQIEASKGVGVFTRKSSHLVHHVVRDKMTIQIKKSSGILHSNEFSFPFGPHGGKLVPLGELYAELRLRGDITDVFLLNSSKKPTKVNAKEITITFTEPDGEKENYGIMLADGSGKSTWFTRDDDHVIKHIKRDKMALRLNVGKDQFQSETFSFSKR